MPGEVFIIAEAGVNHNRKLDLAYRLVDVAKEAGVNAVKFQTFKSEKLVSVNSEMATYQKQNLGTSESQYEMLKRLELPYEQFILLKEYCDKVGITFLSTPDEEDSLNFLVEKLKVPLIKIGSGEVTNLPYLEQITQKGLPVILSTGMANLMEVGEAVATIQKNIPQHSNTNFPMLTLMHCTSNYPTAYDEVNLRAMLTIKEVFKLPVGYSDHTMGTEVAIAAVTLGATIIEKHFTVDKSLPGPDHKASLDPTELKAMVSAIRNIEKSLGNGLKEPTSSEFETMKVVRKSLIATKDLSKGHILTEEDFTIKRPGTGIQPCFKNVVLGLRLTKNINKETPIDWASFKEN